MESEVEDRPPSSDLLHVSILRHPAASILGLGLALGTSLLTTALLPSRPPKPLSVAIKLSNEALRGARALHHLHSPAASLLFASETLVKGYKFSSRLNLFPKFRPLSRVVRTMKPCLGAIGVVRHAGSPHDFGFLGFGLLSYGYHFSKNFLKVLKGVGGVEMDGALKNGFDSLGLLVNAVKVARELGHIRDDVDDSSAKTTCFGPPRPFYIKGFRIQTKTKTTTVRRNDSSSSSSPLLLLLDAPFCYYSSHEANGSLLLPHQVLCFSIPVD